MTIGFLVVSYIVLGLIILITPKRLTKQEVYITWIIVSLLTLLSDLTFGLFWDKYDLMNSKGPEPLDLIVEITLPALFGIIYVNFIPAGKRKFILYLLFWVAFSVGYEQISRVFGYISYKGWKVWYSIIFYLTVCLFMRWHSRFIRKAIYKE